MLLMSIPHIPCYPRPMAQLLSPMLFKVQVSEAKDRAEPSSSCGMKVGGCNQSAQHVASHPGRLPHADTSADDGDQK